MESAQWVTALWRLVNILLGIALDLAASSLILPVTSRQATKRRVQVRCGVVCGSSTRRWEQRAWVF